MKKKSVTAQSSKRNSRQGSYAEMNVKARKGSDVDLQEKVNDEMNLTNLSFSS